MHVSAPSIVDPMHHHSGCFAQAIHAGPRAALDSEAAVLAAILLALPPQAARQALLAACVALLPWSTAAEYLRCCFIPNHVDGCTAMHIRIPICTERLSAKPCSYSFSIGMQRSSTRRYVSIGSVYHFSIRSFTCMERLLLPEVSFEHYPPG